MPDQLLDGKWKEQWGVLKELGLPLLTQVSDSEEVDLELLACQYVSISFAAINVNGLSQYSPAKGVCVIGGMSKAIFRSWFDAKKGSPLDNYFPQNPESRYPEEVELKSISFTIEEDFTMFKNAIIAIYWKPPKGIYVYLKTYINQVVLMQLFLCSFPWNCHCDLVVSCR